MFRWATPTELRMRDILTPSFTGGYSQATPMEFKFVHTTILFIHTTILFIHTTILFIHTTILFEINGVRNHFQMRLFRMNSLLLRRIFGLGGKKG
jgi:hypothetical protein